MCVWLRFEHTLKMFAEKYYSFNIVVETHMKIRSNQADDDLHEMCIVSKKPFGQRQQSLRTHT